MRGWRCRWRGHDWFPDNNPMEFLVVEDICLRHCGTKRVRLPYGECLNKHPIAEHYNAAGDLIEHPLCPRPM